MSTDATLLRLYAETRAEDAFAELVRRHLDAVYSAALRRVGGDSHLAQDVSQQVFVALARKARSVVAHPALTSWLYVTTRNEAASLVRSERRRKAREQSFSMQDFATEKAPEIDWTLLGPVIDAAIDQLGELERTAVLLRFLEGRRFSDIGTALNLSEDAARMRVERALEKLRAHLARGGVASSSAALGAALAHHAVMAAPPALTAQVIGAVASAVAGTGIVTSLAGVWEFMGTAKILGGVTGVVALATVLGLATGKIQSSRTVESALSAAEERHAEALARRREAQERLRATRQVLAQLNRELGNAQEAHAAKPISSAVNGVSAAPASPATLDPKAVGDVFMARHPEVKRAVNDYARARVDFRYAELYSKLGLSTAQIETFRDLMSAGFGMGASGPNGESMSLTSGDLAVVNERNAQLKTLLGGEGMKASIDFAVWTEPARDRRTDDRGCLAKRGLGSSSPDTCLGSGESEG